ncbi:MAG: eukaryotic-like serine/threonine-protein kinase [Thermoanaerobaculia bacterium]|jgi:serine/threonine protein kinase|nr:eukaryotic-like serine/threonine-protein kinase [Thermoanaerobaculia bacterium]
MASDDSLGISSLGPGKVLDGKYEILTRLGGGGMGDVFKAQHVHLNVFRCIKVMKESMLADEGYRQRFLREARLATQIHHPNIAVVHDFFIGDGGSYMVTEFIDGTTVRQWGRTNGGPYPLPLAADIAVQVLSGLDHIHRRGLLHRDISADNVMLSYDEDGSLIAKIIDLGIAKDVNTPSTEMATQAGMLIGNPKYMSPEQLGSIEDGEQLDGRADLYALGVVLYEMLLGVPPFASETPQGYIMKHLTQPPRRFRDAKPDGDWSATLEAVVLRALEKDRRRRFADAREMSAALQPFLTAPAGTLTRDAVARLRRGPMPTFNSAVEWRKTRAIDTIAAYRHYLAKVPDGSDTTEAKARLFELSLIETVRAKEAEGDRNALQRLAEAHPPGTAVGDATREALARVAERAQEEERAFQQAWEAGTPAAWTKFIDEHPGSPRTDEAKRCRQESTEFDLAVAANSATMWRAFLKSWPEGRHRLDADIRLRAKK